MKREPFWLSRLIIEVIHFDQVREHGGRRGVRDVNLLESALARARNKWSYSHKPDLATLAAAYGFGIVKSHPFEDGNKRVGFVAMVVFLGLNGYEFEAAETDVVSYIVDLAAGRLTEKDLADWIRSNMRRSPRIRRS